jgi:hypothetical protein
MAVLRAWSEQKLNPVTVNIGDLVTTLSMDRGITFTLLGESGNHELELSRHEYYELMLRLSELQDMASTGEEV